ncbi:hypothetical protein [Imtechella halotolerans]|nr:hypothetical protein [Imtechella halotolerans]WMQ62343.1 hypothetical protein PT603_08325 [Imtechella halotolerans]
MKLERLRSKKYAKVENLQQIVGGDEPMWSLVMTAPNHFTDDLYE